MKHDYRYISKKQPEVMLAFHKINCILHELQIIVRAHFTFSFYPVGSYTTNMITVDYNSNVGYDFDFNLNINDDGRYSPKEIRNILREGLNKAVAKYGYDYPEDSTSVLTIKSKDVENARIIHSCDFAIVHDYANSDRKSEVIVYDKRKGSYDWCVQTREFDTITKKAEELKKRNLWGILRQRYLDMKNSNTDYTKSSISIFAQVVYEMCDENGI